MQQSLSRIVGTHMTLLGLLSTSIMPHAAFAATDTKTVDLTVNVGSVITLTTPNPGALTNVPGGPAQTSSASISVATNAQNGFKLTAKGIQSGSCSTSVLCHSVDGSTPITDVLADYAGGVAAGTGAELGLTFRITTGAGLTVASNDAAANWFPSSVAKYGAFPVGSAVQILDVTGDSSSSMTAAHAIPIEYRVSVPGTQKEGVYEGTVEYTAVTNAI